MRQAHDDGGSRFSRGRRSAPLLGRLPVARLIPQDVPSAVDYAGSTGFGGTALLSGIPAAQHASLGLMAFGPVVSLATDYRPSLLKLVPIEVHEVLDYLLGAAMILSPFLFAYARTAPTVSALHVAGGALLILMATVTDYRASAKRRDPSRGTGRRAPRHRAS